MVKFIAIACGLSLFAGNNTDNKHVFKSIRAFYYGICHDDMKNDGNILIAMYERGDEQIFMKIINSKGKNEIYGVLFTINDGKSIELKKTEIEKLLPFFDKLPSEFSYLNKNYHFVGKFKLGAPLVVP